MNCDQFRQQLDDLIHEGVRVEPDDFKEHRLSCVLCCEYCDGFYHALHLMNDLREADNKRTFTTYEAAKAEDRAHESARAAQAQDETNRGIGMSLEESKDATWDQWCEVEKLHDLAAFAWDHVVFSPKEKAFNDAETERLQTDPEYRKLLRRGRTT